MTVNLEQPVREVVMVKAQAVPTIRIEGESRPSVITITAQGPIGPQGPLRDDTDYLMYYQLAKG